MTTITPSSITATVGSPPNLYVPPGTTGLSVAAAMRYLKLTPNASIVSIKDTAQNIQRNLASLQASKLKIDTIESSDTNLLLKVTHKDYLANIDVMSKWKTSTDHKISITDITAASATSIWNAASGANRSFIDKLSVRDTAINLQTNFNSLRTIAAIDTVIQTNISAVIKLDTAQYRAGAVDGNFLSKINKGSYNVSITGASVEDVLATGDLGSAYTATGLDLSVKSQVKSISIVSTTQSIDDNISKLQKYGLKISSIAQSDTGANADLTLDLSATEIKSNLSVIGKITTGYKLHAENTSSAQLSSMIANRKVISVDIVDKASNIAKSWTTLNAINNGTLNSVTVSDGGAIKISASQLAVGKNLIDKFENPNESPTTLLPSFTFEISDATASQASEFISVNEISKFTVSDTAANILGYLDELSSTKVNAIKMSNSSILEMDYITYSNSTTQDTLDKINKGAYNVRLVDINIEDAVATAALDKGIEGFVVSDYSSNLDSAALNSLNLIGSRLKSIDIKLPDEFDLSSEPEEFNAAKKITISANSFINRQSVLNKISHGYTASLTGATVKEAISLSSNIHVADFDISDSVQNISSNWDNLLNIQNKLDEFNTNLSVEATLTADQYERGLAADLQSKFVDGDSHLKFKVLDATIVQAQTLLTADSEYFIQRITVKDSSKNVSENLGDLQLMIDRYDIVAYPDPLNAPVNNGLVDIKLTDLNKMDIEFNDVTTYDDVLDKINGGSYRLNVTKVPADEAVGLAASSKVSSMIVESSAQSISENFDALLSVGKKISGVVVDGYADANIAISHRQYQEGSSFLDKFQENYFLKLTEVPVYIASTLAANDHVKDMEVKGSPSLISKTWDALVGLSSKITNISKSVAGFIDLTYNQWTKISDLFGKFSDTASKFNVSGVSLDSLTSVVSDEKINLISIQDDAQNISTDFYVGSAPGTATLKTNLSKINEIILTNSSVALEVPTITSDINDVLQKIKSNNYLITLNAASVADATSLAIDNSKSLAGNTNTDKPYYDNIKSINIVTDDKTTVSNNWDSLKSIAKLNSIALPAADEALSLSATTVLNSSELLGKILSYQLNVSNSTMLQLAELDNLNHVSTVSIQDSNDQISNYDNFNKIINLKPNLTDILITGTDKDLNITYNQWVATSTKLNALPSNTTSPFSFNLRSVFANDVTTTVLDNTSIETIQVRDSASSISLNWDALNTAYGTVATPGKLTALSFYKIEEENPNVQVPDFGSLSLSSEQLVDPVKSRLLSLVTVENPIELKDTPESIQTNWDALVTAFDAGTFQSAALSYASVPDKITLTAAKADAGAALMNKFPPDTFIVTNP
jgi:hypothetical protein